MIRARRTRNAALALAWPGIAWAHGQQALGLPVGSILALGIVTLLVLWRDLGWKTRLLALAAAVAGAVPVYTMRHPLPASLEVSGAAWFLLGLIPPLTTAGLYASWRRATRGRHER